MELNTGTLLRFARAYARVGTAIQEQINDVLVDGESADEMNAIAMRAARELFALLPADDDEVINSIDCLTPSAEVAGGFHEEKHDDA